MTKKLIMLHDVAVTFAAEAKASGWPVVVSADTVRRVTMHDMRELALAEAGGRPEPPVTLVSREIKAMIENWARENTTSTVRDPGAPEPRTRANRHDRRANAARARRRR
jgi:hypothetical protein